MKTGVDTKIMILCDLDLEILSKLDFRCDNFEKWPKPISRPNFFSGNIVNTIHKSPLMVPLLESSGGGMHEDQCCPMGYLCQL